MSWILFSLYLIWKKEFINNFGNGYVIDRFIPEILISKEWPKWLLKPLLNTKEWSIVIFFEFLFWNPKCFLHQVQLMDRIFIMTLTKLIYSYLVWLDREPDSPGAHIVMGEALYGMGRTFQDELNFFSTYSHTIWNNYSLRKVL